MQITAIAKQQKRSDRYSVFIDGKFSFSLSDSGLLSSGLVVGQELDNGAVKKLKTDAEEDLYYYRVLNLLALRSRSTWEIEDYLKRKDCPAPIIKVILNKLSSNGLIDDLQFARSWVSNRQLLKPSSRRRLIYELRAKHLNSEIINQVLDEVESDDERQALRLVVEKKRRQAKYSDDLKLMQYLARQGFNYDDIKAVLKESD